MVKTSIVILTYNKLDYTKQCIESIRQYTDPDTYELIVVDNHSTDGTSDWLNDQRDIRAILNDENMGFPKGCNQGIEAATGDQILLLNNDTVVTVNWLSNMTRCLQSSADIGAAGAITNSCAYYQSIPVTYSSIDEMQQFAEKINISDENQWEERLKLIGFCLLIKRSVIDEIGMLDEIFSPGNFEDDDFSFRLKSAGYRLMLCKDAFIHHYGSVSFREDIDKYRQQLMNNEIVFFEKWGFNSYFDCLINDDLTQLIQPDASNESVKILEIGCRCGGTLLSLKNKHPNIQLFGIEENKNCASIAQSFADVQVRALNELNATELGYPEQFFDYVIIDARFETVKRPEQLLEAAQKMLKPQGILLASFYNALHYSVIQSLLSGQAVREQLNYFLPTEIEQLFEKVRFEKLEVHPVTRKLASDETFINHLAELNNGEMSADWSIYQNVVQATMNQENKTLIHLLRDMIHGNQASESIQHLTQFEPEHIIQVILNETSNPIPLLNQTAVLLFSHQHLEHVLPLLKKAIEIQPAHRDTLVNLGSIFHQLGESSRAMSWLKQIENPDDSVLQLMEQIGNPSGQLVAAAAAEEIALKSTLRRIENDVQVDESQQWLLELIENQSVSMDNVLRVVERDIIFKDKVLNAVAIVCFENKAFDWVLPLLEKSYEINPTNANTLFSLGFLLHQFGENKKALNFLDEIEVKDSEVHELISRIKEAG